MAGVVAAAVGLTALVITFFSEPFVFEQVKTSTGTETVGCREFLTHDRLKQGIETYVIQSARERLDELNNEGKFTQVTIL